MSSIKNIEFETLNKNKNESDQKIDNVFLGKRKTIKGIIIGTIIGVVISGGIGVAAVTLTADQIKYTPSNEKFTATNAEEALNEIYKIAEYEIPADTYFYQQGTEGNSSTIVRYKKVDNKYFLCDQYGKVANGTSATDITNKNLVAYTTENAGNISAGSAGYASGVFYLGDGSDNLETYNKVIDTLYDKVVALGKTPTEKNLDSIMKSIESIASTPKTVTVNASCSGKYYADGTGHHVTLYINGKQVASTGSGNNSVWLNLSGSTTINLE